MKAPDTLAAEEVPGHNEIRLTTRTSDARSRRLIEQFRQVRDFSTRLCRSLEPEDYVVQSMPDVSPTKWHLAHTSWFFETFVLKVWMQRYRSEVPQYAYLFNSYYNAAGDMHRRDLRGLISRPTVAETYRFRESIDQCVIKLIRDADDALLAEIEPVLTLGVHHEQHLPREIRKRFLAPFKGAGRKIMDRAHFHLVAGLFPERAADFER